MNERIRARSDATLVRLESASDGTHREIARERYALKAMRGDFDDVPARDAGGAKRVRAALAAVDK